RAVRGAEADVAAERRRLLDRAAGVGAERPRGQAGADRCRGASARAARRARGIPRVVRRAVGGVLGRGAHRELVRVRLAENPEALCLQPFDDGRVVDRDVALEDLRAGRRGDPFRPDHVLERDRQAVAARVVTEVEVAVELLVAVVDRGAVGGEELGAGDLAGVHEPPRLFGSQAKRVDHVAPPGGTRKQSPSRSGASAGASSTGGQGAGWSAPRTWTTSSGCEVAGTSERSSSETFETASRMSLSCPSSRSTPSSRNSSRARRATWSSCSLSIAIAS